MTTPIAFKRCQNNFLTHKMARKITIPHSSNTYICIHCNQNILINKCDRIASKFHPGKVIYNIDKHKQITPIWDCCDTRFYKYSVNGCEENLYLTLLNFFPVLIVDKLLCYNSTMIDLRSTDNEKYPELNKYIID